MTDPAHTTGRPTTADEDPLLAEIVRRLVKAYHPERIYLFGSHARGEAGPDSDYDLMLIVRDDAPAPLRASTQAYDALWGLRSSGDVLVWTRNEFNRRQHLQASLPATVLREGKLLYADQPVPGGRGPRVAGQSR